MGPEAINEMGMTLKDLMGWGVAALVIVLTVPLVIWLGREYMKLKDELIKLLGMVIKSNVEQMATLAAIDETVKNEGQKTQEIRDHSRSLTELVKAMKETLDSVNRDVVALCVKHK